MSLFRGIDVVDNLWGWWAKLNAWVRICCHDRTACLIHLHRYIPRDKTSTTPASHQNPRCEPPSKALIYYKLSSRSNNSNFRRLNNTPRLLPTQPSLRPKNRILAPLTPPCFPPSKSTPTPLISTPRDRNIVRAHGFELHLNGIRSAAHPRATTNVLVFMAQVARRDVAFVRVRATGAVRGDAGRDVLRGFEEPAEGGLEGGERCGYDADVHFNADSACQT
jgi:hypothetical protein